MEPEAIKEFIIICFVCFIAYKLIDSLTTDNTNNGKQIYIVEENQSLYSDPGNKGRIALMNKIQSEELNLKSIELDFDVIRDKINNLDLENSYDFEDEGKNEMEIRKLEIQLEKMLMKIDSKKQKIYYLNEKMKGIE